MNYCKIIGITFIFFILSCSTKFEEKDIYVNKLVYFKKNNALFTGTLQIADNASTYSINFCKGLPCGEHEERENNQGPLVTKGKYLSVKETLSKSTLQMLSNETVFINYWQEGGDIPSDPYHFTLLILKDDVFFQLNKMQYDNYIHQLANSVKSDTQNFKYNYLKIIFVNAVYNWTKEYSKEYEIKDGRLQEI